MTTEAQAIADTQAWVEKAVIGLNLCPFAKAVVTKKQVRYVMCMDSEPDHEHDACELLGRHEDSRVPHCRDDIPKPSRRHRRDGEVEARNIAVEHAGGFEVFLEIQRHPSIRQRRHSV